MTALTSLASGLVLLALYALLVLQPLGPSNLVRWAPVGRDLLEIRRQGVLRVALPDDPIAYDRRGPMAEGLAYDLAVRVSGQLGLKLEIVPVATPGAGLRALAKGKADVLGLADAGPLAVLEPIVWTGALERVHPVVIGRDAGAIRKLEDLRDRTVTVRRATTLEAAALSWQAAVAGRLRIARVHQRTSDEDLYGDLVDSGGLVMMDEKRGSLLLAQQPLLQMSAPLGDPLPIRWAIRSDSPVLAAELGRLLDDARGLGFIAELERKYLENPLRYERPSAAAPESHWEVADGQLFSPFDGLLQSTASRHGFDWRLIAALVYTESRFDPHSIGPGGSAGLCQLMPATSRSLGLTNPLDPEQNIAGGVRHLRWMHDRFPGVPEPDRLAFALAAYNIGIGHMDDVRQLAASRGLDPNRWSDVGSLLPLKEDRAVASTMAHGLARGRLTLGYVTRILELYERYTRIDETARQVASAQNG